MSVSFDITWNRCWSIVRKFSYLITVMWSTVYFEMNNSWKRLVILVFHIGPLGGVLGHFISILYDISPYTSAPTSNVLEILCRTRDILNNRPLEPPGWRTSVSTDIFQSCSPWTPSSPSYNRLRECSSSKISREPSPEVLVFALIHVLGVFDRQNIERYRPGASLLAS